MKDLTMEIAMAGETKAMEKQLEETRRYNNLINILNSIKSNAEKMDIFIKNGEALRWAGLLEPDYHRWSEDSLYADGIHHRLGFMNARKYKGDVINALGVFGGGANGNVSVIYSAGEMWLADEWGDNRISLFYISDERCETVESRIGYYTREAEKFLKDLNECEFEGKLERYLEKVL